MPTNFVGNPRVFLSGIRRSAPCSPPLSLYIYIYPCVFSPIFFVYFINIEYFPQEEKLLKASYSFLVLALRLSDLGYSYSSHFLLFVYWDFDALLAVAIRQGEGLCPHYAAYFTAGNWWGASLVTVFGGVFQTLAKWAELHPALVLPGDIAKMSYTNAKACENVGNMLQCENMEEKRKLETG